MSEKPGIADNSFLIWIIANVLGFCVLAGSLFLLPFLKSFASIAVTSLIISIPISLAQWMALRRFFQISPLWILTVPTGLLFAALVNQAIPAQLWQIVDDESIAVLVFLFMVLGFAVGLSQWLILRRHFSGSVIWVLGSLLSVAGGFWLVLATDLINQSEILAYIIVLLIYASLTGLILSRLLIDRDKPQVGTLNVT